MNLIVRLMVVSLALAAVGCATRSPVSLASENVTLPVVVTRAKPYYTQEALEAKIEGTVLLDCVVRADGTVGAVRVLRSLDSVYGLDRQAVQTLKQWTFEPGTRDGVPVPVRVEVDVTFALQ